MIILETDRLILRTFNVDDAAFYFELWKQASWIQYIGDKKFRNVDDARESLINGPMRMYADKGFSLFVMGLKDGTLIGMCGLIKRDTLDDVDIGYGLLPEFEGKGYAHEAAAATLAYAKNHFGIKRLVAIVTPENHASIKLLEKIGLRYEKMIALTEGTEELKLFAADI
ncbi:MAG: GNAT family N-acetyltransferase [Burkholderiales bacterium]